MIRFIPFILVRGLVLLCGAAVSGATDTNSDLVRLPPTQSVDLGDGVTMEFVLIQPGSFSMGTASHEPDEGPVRHVTLTQPYYIGRYEVTQAQWLKVMGNNPSRFQGKGRPVDNVSWADCQRFVQAVTGKVGRAIVLPTEAQWEYACRAGTTTDYSFGDDPAELPNYAWYCSNSELMTHPVGQKKPNAWGLYDMHGNVYEWCADWYSEGPYIETETVDPVGASTGSRRVLRGGGWIFVPDNLRSADRAFSPPNYKSSEYGLRCVMLPGALATSTGQDRVGKSRDTQERELARDVPATPLAETLTILVGRGVTMEFVLVHPGSFTMGAKASESSSDGPAHAVVITRPYYIGEYEVTQAQWNALMEQNWSACPPATEEGNRARYPVDSVSWALCQSFLAKLNAQGSGYRLRLPTEAEWEYACRAGHDGGDDLASHAWYADNSGGRTHPVGEKQPNAWGIYDMCGNVWEWCEDSFAEYRQERMTDPLNSDPVNAESVRVLRGGAWNNTANHVTPWYRHADSPSVILRYYGFRCVAEILPSPASR